MNILIIRPGAIGDTLLTFPIVSTLRSACTESRVTFVGNNTVLPLTLEWRLAEEVSDYQSPQWSELFSTKGIQDVTLRERLGAIELAICWLRDPDHIVERNLLAAGVKRCIVAPGRPPEGAHIHIVDYLASTIIGKSPLPALPDTRKGYPYILASHPFQPHAAERRGMGVIAIHPGSGSRQKCWPVERFAQVIEAVWRRGWPVLVLTGPADEEQRAYLQRHLVPPSPEMLEMLDGAPLLEVARRLQGCRCYLGNDSGITHLAALLGLPTIALFGPSDPATWRPVGKHVTVIYEPLLAHIAVSAVISAIEQGLHD